MSTTNVREKIIAKAWKDAEFRRSLISAPELTLSKEFGIDLPQGIEIKVVEESSSTTYFVIPPCPATKAEGDVSTADLEAVAAAATSNTNVMSGCRCCSSPSCT